MPFVDEALDLELDLAKGHGAGPLGLESKLKSELAAEVGGVHQGVVNIDGADLVWVEVVAEPPQGGGLAAAGLAGEQAERLRVDEIAQSRVELVERRRPEELVGGQGTLEGRMGQAEGGGVEAHFSPSPWKNFLASKSR